MRAMLHLMKSSRLSYHSIRPSSRQHCRQRTCLQLISSGDMDPYIRIHIWFPRFILIVGNCNSRAALSILPSIDQGSWVRALHTSQYFRASTKSRPGSLSGSTARLSSHRPGFDPPEHRGTFSDLFGYIRHAATPETPALSLTKSVLKFRVVC